MTSDDSSDNNEAADEPTLSPDQRPESWSAGAAGYADHFARYTSLYADDTIALAGIAAGQTVLEVAAGSGALTLPLARTGAKVHATDFAPGMVDLLRQRLVDEGLAEQVTLEQMDGQSLRLQDDSTDSAVSMFGFLFFPDFDAGFSEFRRVVRPGGKATVVSWDFSRFAMYELTGAAFAAALPEMAPAPGQARPDPDWAILGHADTLADHFHRAGFASCEVHSVDKPWHMPDPRSFFYSLPQWSPPMQPLFDSLPAAKLNTAADAFAEAAQAKIDSPDGLRATALIAVGVV